MLAGFVGRLTKNDARPDGPRIDAENTMKAFVDRGVRSCVVPLPPSVHGCGVYGFVSLVIAIARATGTSGYLGAGDNRWPSAHVRDGARIYRLALESAPAGARMHAVAEEGIPLREIAQTIGHHLDVPVSSIATANAERHFGELSAFVGLDNPTSSQITRDALAWSPTHPDLLSDLEQDRDLATSVESS